ncbi:MAG: DUF885 domain-containing protein [Verrucomicrobiota bacterium]
MRKLTRLVAGGLLAILAAACSGPVQNGRLPGTPPITAKSWDLFVQEYIDGYFRLRPDLAISAGRHEFDGRLPDWSPAGMALMVHFLEEQQAAAQRYEPVNRAQALEQDYLLSQIESDLFWIQRAKAPYKNPSYYNALDPAVYVTREYAPLQDRLVSLIAYEKNVPTAVDQIQKNLQTPLPRTYIGIGRTIFGGLATFLQNEAPKVFAPVQDGALQSEYSEVTAEAVAALKRLDKWLENQLPEATEDFALGPDLFQEMLWKTERVKVPLAELERIGRADLDRNLAALRLACQKLAPGRPMQQAIAMVRANKPKEGVVQAARNQLDDLKYFILEKQLVSIPSPQTALVEESPEYMRWNSAFINIPGPYEKGLPSIYYIAPPDPKWSQKEQAEYIASYYDLLFTSVHEVWPGHFLQFLHSNQASSRFGQLFLSYAFVEGWAHYTEEMMWDAGLGKGDPEAHIGQLLNALTRNVRFLSAIGLHTGKMTVADSERMFQELAFQDPGTARQQAARGTFDPAYLNYTMGKLMIRKLRDDWCAKRGGRDAWRDFHDKFLSYGGPPIPLLRREMLNDTEHLF